jgi:hypothetical protein
MDLNKLRVYVPQSLLKYSPSQNHERQPSHQAFFCKGLSFLNHAFGTLNYSPLQSQYISNNNANIKQYKSSARPTFVNFC